jgi:exonuclease SbcC
VSTSTPSSSTRGFGSLDPESLELAVDTLMDLQQSGRLVGVISHVPELKERLDARLEVNAARGGSSASFVVP